MSTMGRSVRWLYRGGLVVAAMVWGSPLHAAGPDLAEVARGLGNAWILVAVVLVFIMHAGFAMVESGFTRAKNACNIISKNVFTFSVGVVAFFLVGYGIILGSSYGGLFGSTKFFMTHVDPATPEGIDELVDFLFNVVFAATAATIVSGVVAERLKFEAYLLYSAVQTALIYPVVAHWGWGEGGWLAELGFADFAGSTLVHSCGAWVGLAGALLLGARLGKYNGDGSSNPLPGHNIPIGALGVFLLWFGWYGFNGAAGALYGSGMESVVYVFTTTTLGAAAGALGAMFASWIRDGLPDTSIALNGVLGGLVSITAGCAGLSLYASLFVGLVAGILVDVSIVFFDTVLKVDDPVGAITVHGVCGAWGTIMLGVFNPGVSVVVQTVGVLAVFAWSFATGLILFGILKATVGLRVTDEEEMLGLDISEHGMEAYAGFEIFLTETSTAREGISS